MKCVLCGIHIEDLHGNNPDPLSKEGRCCDNCNISKVIPERMKRIQDKSGETMMCKGCGNIQRDVVDGYCPMCNPSGLRNKEAPKKSGGIGTR